MSGRWVDFPPADRPRWSVPRSPRRAAANGLLIYKPVTLKAVVGWSLARTLALSGAFHLLPGRAAPVPIETAWAEGWVPPGGSVAVGRGRRPGRYHLVTLDARGNPHAMVKVAVDDVGARELRAEASALRQWSASVPTPLRAPDLLYAGNDMLVTEAVAWSADPRPWRLPVPVAAAMGTWYRGSGGPGLTMGPAHGDFTPWNLLRTGRQWVLCDWATAQPVAPAFFDLFHWLVSSNALLGRPSVHALLAGIDGRGWIGAAINAWAEAAGLPSSQAATYLTAYLETAAWWIDPDAEDGRRALLARDRLRTALASPA